MTGNKLMTMREAIERFVPDGSSVALGLALEPLIPFAAGHEIIRQGRRDLTLIGPISDILFDQLIGAGCVAKSPPPGWATSARGWATTIAAPPSKGLPHPHHRRRSQQLQHRAGAAGGRASACPTSPCGHCWAATSPATIRPSARSDSPLDGDADAAGSGAPA